MWAKLFFHFDSISTPKAKSLVDLTKNPSRSQIVWARPAAVSSRLQKVSTISVTISARSLKFRPYIKWRLPKIPGSVKIFKA